VATATLGATPIIGDVLIQDNLALVRSWYGYEGVVSFDLETFELKWATAVPYLIENRSNTFLHGIPTMAVTPDSVYLFDAQDNLLRINLLTGKIIWTAPSSGVQAMSRPAANHGLVYGLFADGTLRAFSEVDGSSIGVVMKVPLWYWRSTDTKEWRDLVGGLDIVDDTLIVTTGCHNVYAIQHEP
jgi:outer membrane protein assembly factor BamB